MSIRPSWLRLVLDTPVADFEEAVTFWSAVTGWEPSDRRGEDGGFLTLLPPQGSAYVTMQAADGAARVHLDLDSTDRPAMLERATALGATPAWTHHDMEAMRSPGGLPFCQTLVDGEPALVRDGSTVLDQVCVDVPASRWETEVAFWRDLTGRELQQATGPGFARLVAPGQARILLQQLDEADGTVRAHPDVASADRAADTASHVALGADVVAVHDHWTVLVAPGGQVYCLTDRDPTTGAVRRRV